MRALLPLLLAMLTTPACKAEPKAKCEPEGLADVTSALAQVAPERRSELALAGLAQACPEPASLAKAMAEVPAVAPDQRAMLLAKAIQANTDLWTRACPAGTALFAKLATASPAERDRQVWAGCKIERFGFAKATEANGKPFLMVAVMYAQVLEDAQVEPAGRRVFLRALLGL